MLDLLKKFLVKLLKAIVKYYKVSNLVHLAHYSIGKLIIWQNDFLIIAFQRIHSVSGVVESGKRVHFRMRALGEQKELYFSCVILLEAAICFGGRARKLSREN
jgi:hypothetical protein